MKSKSRTTSYVLLTALFLAAFFERVVFDLGPNIELVTTAMLLASAYFGRKHSLLLTLAIMVATDMVLGNTNIFIFTWSGFLIPAIFASAFFRNNKLNKIFQGAMAGMSTTVFFFLWTNFGVWLLSSMYPRTTAGLVQSYINALPFLRYQAVSTLLFVPAGFALSEFAIFLENKFSLTKKLSTHV